MAGTEFKRLRKEQLKKGMEASQNSE